MSATSFGVNDALAVKLWSKILAVAERDSLEIAPLMGDDDNAIIHVKDETELGQGDRVTFSLRARGTQKGFTEGQTAEGNAESLTFFSDNILINELGCNFGARSQNTIDQQRIPFELREQCKNTASDWWKDRKAAVFFNQVCGFTPANTESATSGIVYTGHNAVTAPVGTSALVRQIWAGSAANDQGLTASDTYTLSLIDIAVQNARLGNRMIRPVTVGGQNKHVIYLHEGQVTQLRTNTSTGQWQDVTKFAYSGVDVSKNPIYTGALGEYNNCVLRRSQDVTQGVNSSTGAAVANTRRAVLLGAQSGCCAFGKKNYGPNKYRWNEELLDHKRLLEVSAWSIWGMKKAVFNVVDHGAQVISTYSAV